MMTTAPSFGPLTLNTLGILALESSDFNRTKPLLFLSYLSLEGAKTRQHLAELFWPEATDPQASLSTELSRLKKYLGEVVRVDGPLVTTLIRSDVQKFLEALEKKDTKTAVELYKGSFLEGVVVSNESSELEEWLYATREFLAGCYAKAQLELGQALAREGTFAEAAQCAKKACQVLGSATLGPEELHLAHTLLLAGEHPLVTRLEEEASELGLRLTPNVAAARSQFRVAQSALGLPTYATSFIGRREDIQRVSMLLREQARLVTIVGLAGMGKSRLAVEVVRTLHAEGIFPDGSHLVWLDTLSNPDEVLTHLANTLRLELKDQSDIATQIVKNLSHQQCLIYFDNYEHVMASAPFLSQLLAQCPALKILVTSRERLNLEEEHVCWLEGLPFEGGENSEAVQLFLNRAKRADVSFTASEEDRHAIHAIAKLVEGSPLALELAASWIRLMSCGAIRSQLQKNLDLLTTTHRNVPERHKSIEAALEYSWKLLSGEEQNAMRRLAVFRGGFTREAASDVTGVGFGTLVSLANKSLLRHNRVGRFDRHPLLYSFVWRALSQDRDEQERYQTLHGRYLAKVLALCQNQLKRERIPEAVYTFGEEFFNVQAAWSFWVEREQWQFLLDFAATLSELYISSGRCREGVDFINTTLEKLHDKVESHPLLIGTLQQQKALLCEYLGQFPTALEAITVSLTSFERAGVGPALAEALTMKGLFAMKLGQLDEAAECLRRGLELAQILEEKRTEARCANNLGNVYGELGDEAAAYHYLEHALTLRRSLDEPKYVAIALNNLACVYLDFRKPEQAETYLQEGLAIFQKLGDRSREAFFLANLARAARQREDFALVERYCHQGIALEQSLQQEANAPVFQIELAKVQIHQGHYEQAQQRLSEVVKLTEARGRSVVTIFALVTFAELRAKQGRAKESVILLGHILGNPITYFSDRQDAERILAEITLPPPQKQPLLEKGAALTLEKTLALSLDLEPLTIQ